MGGIGYLRLGNLLSPDSSQLRELRQVPSKNMEENIMAKLAEIGKVTDDAKDIKCTMNKQSDVIFENLKILKSRLKS